MGKYKKLSHVVYKCEYHIVWVPKYRFRILTGVIKDMVEEDIRMLCEWKGCEVLELNVQIDHIHLLVSIPPRVSVSKLMGTLNSQDGSCRFIHPSFSVEFDLYRSLEVKNR